ncbi:hypothetical protein [Kitasatospora sp. DSM 101779]|uniref:hypothetical protein n=1 Tax=Kitasatospora sp. DSM 101779 TaxID=2853165 RepID=UPI0021DB6A11|nr:hypothetical protein [Kitasatospora sp. DSM 101779]MCU7827075.1 hypothetical protein [Kitasatospora sp. DSM 101779]
MALDGPTALITTRLPPGATLDDAVRHLGLSHDAVDTDYGLIDLHDGSYALMVTEAAAERVRGVPGAKGPFANPRIEPFGPIQPGPDE